MKFIGIIPARYQSSRFPGKPLAMLGSKPVIEWVYERVKPCFDEVYVATDDERIAETVRLFGGNAVMTSATCKSGTDRCYEAYCKIGGDFDVVVNVQGDEPFIKAAQIETLKSCFEDAGTDIATLVKPFTKEDSYEKLSQVNSPKVVINYKGFALYFSRSVIPFVRDEKELAMWTSRHNFYKHIGIYAYRTQVLGQITALPQSPLELAESLEQLRWLENGYAIKVGFTDIETVGIDTPQDLERAGKMIGRDSMNWYG